MGPVDRVIQLLGVILHETSPSRLLTIQRLGEEVLASISIPLPLPDRLPLRPHHYQKFHERLVELVTPDYGYRSSSSRLQP
jgi:hypothetical protein